MRDVNLFTCLFIYLHRLDQDHEIFERLSTILVNGLMRLEDSQYSPMAVEAVSTIYFVSFSLLQFVYVCV